MHVAQLRRREEQEEEFVAADTLAEPDSEEGAGEPLDDQIRLDESIQYEYDSVESNGDAPQEAESARMLTQERIVYYAMYVQHFGLSDEEVAHMEQLMAVIYGAPPSISYNVHVANFNQALLQEYNRQRYFFCCACNENQVACGNRSCSIYGLNIKRAKRMQRVEVHVMNFIPQLPEVLVRDVEKIIASHQSLHEHRVLCFSRR
ncbi:hypothetical protein Aduo_018648 [Ancylostoma duodenale]